MWVSKQTKRKQTGGGAAQVGLVTAGGQESGVYLGTQRCWLPVLAPGGYRWRPKTGEQVLVLKTGAEGELPCVLACREEENAQLCPGEVELYAPDCSLKLTQAGGVELHGAVSVNGVAIEDMIRRAVAAALGTQEG